MTYPTSSAAPRATQPTQPPTAPSLPSMPALPQSSEVWRQAGPYAQTPYGASSPYLRASPYDGMRPAQPSRVPIQGMQRTNPYAYTLQGLLD